MSEFKAGDKVKVINRNLPDHVWEIVDIHPDGTIEVYYPTGWYVPIDDPADIIPAEPPATPEPAPTGRLQTWGEIIDYENMIEEFKRLTKVYHHVRAIQQSDDAYLGDSPDIDERVIEAAGELAEFVDAHADVIIAALSRED